MATTSSNMTTRQIIFGETFPSQPFEKEDDSPFKDGYSIAKEEVFLAAYVAAGADESNPLHERLVELQDRRERLAQMQRERNERNGADAIVSNAEARSIDELGGLVDDGVDQMTIHTLEAHRMFMGRSREPGGQSAPIIGGKRVAAALRNLWLLTSTLR